MSATQLESPGVGAPRNTHAPLPHLAALANSWRIPLPLSARISPRPCCREKHFIFLLVISHSMCPEQKISTPSMEKHVLAAAPAGTQRATPLARAGVGCLSQTVAWRRGRRIRRTKAQGDTDTTPPPAAAGGSSGVRQSSPSEQ